MLFFLLFTIVFVSAVFAPGMYVGARRDRHPGRRRADVPRLMTCLAPAHRVCALSAQRAEADIAGLPPAPDDERRLVRHPDAHPAGR